MSSDPKREPSADRSPAGAGIGRSKPKDPGAPGVKDGGPVLDREPQGTNAVTTRPRERRASATSTRRRGNAAPTGIPPELTGRVLPWVQATSPRTPP
jgi:hypothetical protein